jgi:hypothetical protein
MTRVNALLTRQSIASERRRGLTRGRKRCANVGKSIADALLPLQPDNFCLQEPPHTFDDVASASVTAGKTPDCAAVSAGRF